MSSDALGAVAAIFAPIEGDAHTLRLMLEEEGVQVQACADEQAFYAALGDCTWCAVVTEEGLDRCSLEGLDASLRRQPPWSDLPVLTLAGPDGGKVDSNRFARLARIGNITLIERPTSREVLLMSIRAALRTRRLQFALRDQWQALQEHAGSLEEAVRERTLSLEREVGERRRVERALAEARRLESLGRLTGGVAHDFNNILQVISGSETLLRMLLAKDANPRSERALDSIRRAAGHGAALTQQLLAYARRQPLNNVALDLPLYLNAAAELLLGSLGPGIDLRLQIAPALWPVSVDPAQLDAALLNVAVNARDAMPGGGKLVLDARNLHLPDAALPEAGELAGEFVCLAMTDEGEGMSDKTARQAFEPFFTTKAVGKGTGLGLSQVYGFASQSDGLAFIRREAVGTTVGILLPRSSRKAEAVQGGTAEVAPHSLSGVRVLCVEDDPVVAETMSSLLAVLDAEITIVDSADAAIEADFDEVDLVLSDVMMPGRLDGIGLVNWLASHHPQIPVVLTSGYMVDPGRLQTLRIQFLRKPYTLGALTNAISLALDKAASS
ncbi:response regulator [Massilia litorea]|uniref:histidine kinase n=1 Tax=Massilia litorea TaxID=2769491 RepID=A0A7L9U9K5_9BURK|nr:response regulator [Massilia litorea]QOL51577.1 response regulator [Massilia litorea]